MTNTIMNKRRRPADKVLLFSLYLAAILSVALLIGIIGFVFYKGAGSVSLAFLTTVTSAVKQTTGIAGNIVNTLYVVALTILLATPLGVGSAIYLNEYAKPGRLVKIIEFTTETLSGIPSIIFSVLDKPFLVIPHTS